METVTVDTVVVNLSKPDEGSNVWVATQSDVNPAQPATKNHVLRSLPPGNGPASKGTEVSWGDQIRVWGHVDTDTFDCDFKVTLKSPLVDIPLGTVYGNLKDDVILKIEIPPTQGEIRFYRREVKGKFENEVWIDLSITFPFGDINDSDKMMEF